MSTAIITGGTRGLGRALVGHLALEGWRVVFDARRTADVERALAEIGGNDDVGQLIGIPGDITDVHHRAALVDAIEDGDLDLLINNAGALGPSPLPRLVDVDPTDLSSLLETNVVAPLRLVSELIPAAQRADGVIVNISSDAAVEAYGGWGPYGASKAALDHISRVLAVEHPDLAIYAFDPGNMRTDMHQAAFPGEDISDRPLPETVVPKLMRLVERRPPSGRYTEADLSTRAVLR